MKTRVETTLGDLIFAISEAAEESMVQGQDVYHLTDLILRRILAEQGK